MENDIYTAHNVFVIWEITILLLKLVLWMEGGGQIALALNGGGRTEFVFLWRGEEISLDQHLDILLWMEGGGHRDILLWMEEGGQIHIHPQDKYLSIDTNLVHASSQSSPLHL